MLYRAWVAHNTLMLYRAQCIVINPRKFKARYKYNFELCFALN